MVTNGIMFCTPAYGGQVFAPHMESCLTLCEDLTRSGVPFEWQIRWHESLVHRARMGMSKAFLDHDPQYSHMMWLDADLDFTPEDVVKLWNLDADIAVGVYRMKTDDSMFAAWIDGELVDDLDQFDGPIEVDYAGTGFMLINRDVIEALSKKVAKYENEVPEIPALYQTPLRHGTLLSEDYFFCELARDNGFKVIMDPSVRLGHWGIKRYG